MPDDEWLGFPTIQFYHLSAFLEHKDTAINRHIQSILQFPVDIVFRGSAVTITQALIFVDLIVFRRENVKIAQKCFEIFAADPAGRIFGFHGGWLPIDDLNHAPRSGLEELSLESREGRAIG